MSSGRILSIDFADHVIVQCEERNLYPAQSRPCKRHQSKKGVSCMSVDTCGLVPLLSLCSAMQLFEVIDSPAFIFLIMEFCTGND